MDVETLQRWLQEEVRLRPAAAPRQPEQPSADSARVRIARGPTDLQGERVVLVDVRSREECEVSTLPGALWCAAPLPPRLLAAPRPLFPSAQAAARTHFSAFSSAQAGGVRAGPGPLRGAPRRLLLHHRRPLRCAAPAQPPLPSPSPFFPPFHSARAAAAPRSPCVPMRTLLSSAACLLSPLSNPQGRTRSSCGRTGWTRSTSGEGALWMGGGAASAGDDKRGSRGQKIACAG